MADVKGHPDQRMTRRERASRTRLRIVQAAYDRFAAHGYAATTMGQIAADAGVAVQTVYFVFHTKPELLVATLKIVGGGPAEPTREVMERDWIRRIVVAPDGATRLAIASDEGTLIYRRLAPVIPAVTAAMSTDPDVRTAWQTIVDGRRRGMRAIVELMAERGELRADVTVDVATDILAGIHRHELYHAFVDECGWSFDRYRAWTYATLCRQLLPGPVADAAVADGSPATAGLGFAAALAEVPR